MADSIASGVAALANTYGGLLLVAVTDKPRIVKSVKEKAIESVAEQSRTHRVSHGARRV
jgi:CTP:molybdopterin cytidylyltransferase MocA